MQKHFITWFPCNHFLFNNTLWFGILLMSIWRDFFILAMILLLKLPFWNIIMPDTKRQHNKMSNRQINELIVKTFFDHKLLTKRKKKTKRKTCIFWLQSIICENLCQISQRNLNIFTYLKFQKHIFWTEESTSLPSLNNLPSTVQLTPTKRRSQSVDLRRLKGCS